ncbi:MAG: calcium-binding EGF-like domain-containing protein, partial [Chitinophagales bacterium]|nr:calcium-binding EGF-like domain-containing protein [Chitinophagales bacterium]
MIERISITSLIKFLSALNLMLLFSACGNPCKEVICNNGGACVDGVCNCPPGYSGEDCSQLTRDLYLGTYNVSEECPNLNAYTVNIFADTISLKRIRIANFSNSFSNTVYA